MADITLASLHDGYTLPAWRVDAPTSRNGGPRKGAVVVIQEIFGITAHIRAMCDLYAAQGYDAIAPGLYDRIEPGFHAAHDADGIKKGAAAAQTTPMKQVAGDVQTCIDALRGPVFITGFCYGGGVSWMAAARCTGLSAASGFYGRIINQMLDAPPKIPIILHYGAHDAAIPQAMVDEVHAACPDVPIYMYDAGHGFCREGSHDFNAAARDVAMQRTLAFFAENGASR